MSRDDSYYKVERCLWRYQINLARLRELKTELEELQAGSDIYVQDYSGRMMSGVVGADPVSSYIQRLMSIEHRISVLEKHILPVQKLREDLSRSTDTMSRNMRLILEQYYLAGVPMTRLLEVTGWGRSTFYSRCFSLVSLAVGYFVEDKD